MPHPPGAASGHESYPPGLLGARADHVPEWQPYPGAGPARAIGRYFRNYVMFSGRASRAEFWWAMGFVWLMGTILTIPVVNRAHAALGTVGGVTSLNDVLTVCLPALMWQVITLSPSLAVLWRRLHDANLSGGWVLLGLTGIGSLNVLIFLLLPSNPRGVRFDPKIRQEAPGPPWSV
jgi:uncharacterized membrane protein YhaH (DUF805 family)